MSNMSKEILLVVEGVSHEKGVSKEVIFDAIEVALATATKKRYSEDAEFRVAIDRETGDYDTWRRWLVFEDESTELEVPDRELRMIDAVDIDENAQPGEYVEVPMESVEFGRIAAQTAKQVIVQKVREAEREQVVEEYKDRVGEIVSGVVKRAEYGNIIVDLGRGVDHVAAECRQAGVVVQAAAAGAVLGVGSALRARSRKKKAMAEEEA